MSFIICVSTLMLLSQHFVHLIEAYPGNSCWIKKKKTDNCNSGEVYTNVPILNGVYCYNDGTGNCKAFAGRFEFEFNTFDGRETIKGPVMKSQYVDDYGYHQRVPVSYNIKGEINYVDRAINWADSFVKTINESPKSLLSTTDINWCQYVGNDVWPYKSAIVDPTKRYHIYFFNRQSCILDTQAPDKTAALQHFNTRFLHNSNLRIDLDMNPVIFAMEDDKVDPGTDRIRLVKNKRQHWYEVEFKVVNDAQGYRYFVEMRDTERLNCTINPEHPMLIPATAYNSSEYCIAEWPRKVGAKNNILFAANCGIDEHEIVDLPKPMHKVRDGKSILIEVVIHNLPRRPYETSEYFYEVDYKRDEDWEKWAMYGKVFTATTTIPIENDPLAVRVILLYAEFSFAPKNKYDENYPMPYIREYTSKVVRSSRPELDRWVTTDEGKKTKVPNLNYVDDIAYLYKCKTILMTFGPLYSEVPHDKFNLQTKAPIGSISKLQIWELANAFFAMPDESDPTLWVYHRTNYMTDLTYTCGSNGELVTATKKSRKYYPRTFSASTPSFIYVDYIVDGPADGHFEETFFTDMGIFKGSIDMSGAPDPAQFPLPGDPIEAPLQVATNWWLWGAVILAIIIIVILLIICLFALRRRRRRGELTGRTARSSNLPGSGRSSASSVRSSMKPSSMGGHSTARSSLKSSRPSSRASGATARSSFNPSSTPSRSRSQSRSRSRLSPSRRSTLTGRSSSLKSRKLSTLPTKPSSTSKASASSKASKL